MVEVRTHFSLYCVLRVLDDYSGQPTPHVSVRTEAGVSGPIRKKDGVFAFLEAPGDAFAVRVAAAFRQTQERTLTRGSVTTIRLRYTDAFPLPMDAAGVSGEGIPDGTAALSPVLPTHRYLTQSAGQGGRLLKTAGRPHPDFLGAAVYIYDTAENVGEQCELEDIADGHYVLKAPLKRAYMPERSRVCRLHTALCGETGGFYLPVPAAEKAFFWPDAASDTFPSVVSLKTGRMRLQ